MSDPYLVVATPRSGEFNCRLLVSAGAGKTAEQLLGRLAEAERGLGAGGAARSESYVAVRHRVRQETTGREGAEILALFAEGGVIRDASEVQEKLGRRLREVFGILDPANPELLQQSDRLARWLEEDRYARHVVRDGWGIGRLLWIACGLIGLGFLLAYSPLRGQKKSEFADTSVRKSTTSKSAGEDQGKKLLELLGEQVKEDTGEKGSREVVEDRIAGQLDDLFGKDWRTAKSGDLLGQVENGRFNAFAALGGDRGNLIDFERELQSEGFTYRSIIQVREHLRRWNRKLIELKGRLDTTTDELDEVKWRVFPRCDWSRRSSPGRQRRWSREWIAPSFPGSGSGTARCRTNCWGVGAPCFRRTIPKVRERSGETVSRTPRESKTRWVRTRNASSSQRVRKRRWTN